MATTELRIRIAARPRRLTSNVEFIQGLRPARLLLAVLIGAFVLALLYILQIQTLVQMGTQITRLENELASELIRQEALRVELEMLHDLASIERRALLDLNMVTADIQNVVPVPDLPDGIDLTDPPWTEPAPPTDVLWWQRILTRLAEPAAGNAPPGAVEKSGG